MFTDFPLRKSYLLILTISLSTLLIGCGANKAHPVDSPAQKVHT
jgi:hypothetical protein